MRLFIRNRSRRKKDLTYRESINNSEKMNAFFYIMPLMPKSFSPLIRPNGLPPAGHFRTRAGFIMLLMMFFISACGGGSGGGGGGRALIRQSKERSVRSGGLPWFLLRQRDRWLRHHHFRFGLVPTGREGNQ